MSHVLNLQAIPADLTVEPLFNSLFSTNCGNTKEK